MTTAILKKLQKDLFKFVLRSDEIDLTAREPLHQGSKLSIKRHLRNLSHQGGCASARRRFK